MSPSRRTLLRTCGVALSAAVGGCLSSSGGSQPTDTESTAGTATTDATKTTESTTTDATTTATAPPEVREVDGVVRRVPAKPLDVEAYDAEPFLALAVGSCECGSNLHDTKPHGVRVFNDTDETLTVELSLTAAGETVLDESYEFDSRTNLALDLRAPRRYGLTVRAGDLAETVKVSRSQIDCNESGTDVAIRGDEIESTSATTELACSTPTTSDNA